MTFHLMDEGQILPERVKAFADCVSDGFGTVKRSEREHGLRVELADNAAYITLSVDILWSGKAELYESSYAALVNLRKERQAFSNCLVKYGTS